MTTAERQSLKSGAINALLWGTATAVASGGKPVGLLLAFVVAVVAGGLSTGVRLPASLLRDGLASVWGGAKKATGLRSASMPVKWVVPLLIATSFAGRGCDGVHLPDVKWPDIDWPDVIKPVVDDGPKRLAVVFIDETESLLPGRGEYRNGKDFHGYLASKGHTWRYGDQDVTSPDGTPPADLASFITDAKAKGVPRVYLNDIATGKCLWSDKPPADPKELIAQMQKIGG